MATGKYVAYVGSYTHGKAKESPYAMWIRRREYLFQDMR